MKTYTEEQLQEAYNRGLMDGRLNNIDYSITDGFKPIELPKPMKTAMQELKDIIENKIIPSSKENGDLSEYQYSHNIAYNTVLTIIDFLLEKEKEQIMDSYLQGSFDDGPNITNSEQYYNQTYNQNELPKTYINGVEVDSNNSSVTTTGVWTPKTN